MPELTILIHDREYIVACEEGSEAQLQAYAAELDQRITYLAKAAEANGSQFSESELLVFGSLMLAEELHQLRQTPEAPLELGKLQLRLQKLNSRFEKLALRLEGD